MEEFEDKFPGIAYLLQWLKYGEDNYTKQLYRIILKTYFKLGFKALVYMAKKDEKRKR